MNEEPRVGTPKWILIATAFVGLVAGLFVLVARYYEIRKARAEAVKAEQEVVARDGRAELPIPPAKTPVPEKIKSEDKILRQPGEEVYVPLGNGQMMTFCWIPPGNVQLGSPNSERNTAIKAGAPPTWVAAEAEDQRGRYATNGFWLGKYPVTQSEWKILMGDNPSHFQVRAGGAEQVKGLDTSRFPVENVSWHACQLFATKLSMLSSGKSVFGSTGKFGLPSEDAWEYACRGGLGNQRPFYWGFELNGTQANALGIVPYGTTVKGPCLQRPSPVGQYAASFPHPWGLCDIHGNVWQWCENCYDQTNRRVLRGGSWATYGRDCRAAARESNLPDYHCNHYGFRLCFIREY